jgi:hypothetical protein
VQGLAWGAPPDYDAQPSTAHLCNWQCVPVRPCSLGWKLRGGVLYVREGGEGNECVSAQENPKPNPSQALSGELGRKDSLLAA